MKIIMRVRLKYFERQQMERIKKAIQNDPKVAKKAAEIITKSEIELNNLAEQTLEIQDLETINTKINNINK